MYIRAVGCHQGVLELLWRDRGLGHHEVSRHWQVQRHCLHHIHHGQLLPYLGTMLHMLCCAVLCCACLHSMWDLTSRLDLRKRRGLQRQQETRNATHRNNKQERQRENKKERQRKNKKRETTFTIALGWELSNIRCFLFCQTQASLQSGAPLTFACFSQWRPENPPI